MKQIDYLLSDPYITPQGVESQYTEKIWRLPETRWCFTPPVKDIPVSVLPANTNGHITFGCFNNLTKINDSVLMLWSQVLHSTPDSCLFIKNEQLRSAAVREQTLERFKHQGIATSRLILEGPSPRADYLAAYNRVDLMLDTFPFPGGTTSVEALWMGLPVLTLAGDRLLERQGVGILINAGLQEWIASDCDDYVRRALLYSSDLRKLNALRQGLRQKVLASPLFDAARFARHIEAALWGMYNTTNALRYEV